MQTSKSEEQIMKGQDKLLRNKIEAQEAGNLYRQHLKTANQNLEILYMTYEPVFNLYDELEIQRINKTKDAINNLVKEFSLLRYSNNETLVKEDAEQKLKEIDEKTNIKFNSLEFFTNNSLTEVLKSKPMEEFLSFEAKKKIDDLTVM